MSSYDVLVIGAGPAGSRAAYGMAARGYKVGVLEKHGTLGEHKCCTGIIGRECVESFDIDRSCIVREAKSARLYAPSGEFLQVSKDEPQAYIVDRGGLDRSLAAKAEASGAVYFPYRYVSDVSVSAAGVEVHSHHRGVPQTFSGRVAIIASGFASKIPRQLGLGQSNRFMVGAQAEVETFGVEEVEVYFSQQLAPGFFAWIAPVSPQKARIGLFAYNRPGVYLRQFIARLALEGKVSGAVPDISYGGIPLKPLARTYAERVLVIGDAAGQVKPTTGGGIYYGLLCADFACETLDEAFARDDFSRRHLARYEKAWKRKLGRELQIDYYARRLYNRLSDKRLNTIFNVVRENDIHGRLMSSSYKSFDWHGEMVLDGMKQLSPWWKLFGKYIPSYVLKSLRGK